MGGQTETTGLKHRTIYNAIYDAIMRGQYKPGDRIPTEKQLAEQFRTSRPTVGRAMRELEERRLIVRHQGVGTFVKRRKHAEGKTLGILLPWQHGETPKPRMTIFAALIPEISRAAGQYAYSLVLNEASSADHGDAVARGRTICKQLIELQVAGVFFMPLDYPQNSRSVNAEIVESFSRAGIPITLLDRDIGLWGDRSKYDVVAADNKRAAFTLTRHLLDMGCTRIDFLMGLTEPSSVTNRLDGFRKALACRGLNPDQTKIVRLDHEELTDATDATMTTEMRSVLERIRQGKTQAVVCVNDATAIRLMQCFAHVGISVPDDVRVVGFDDLPVGGYMPVPLTTMRQNPEALAYEAFRTMLDRMENPAMPARDLLVATELVVRQSCGAHLKQKTGQ